MGVHSEIKAAAAMASHWRMRRMCVLVADQTAPAVLREISGASAFLETNARPALGSDIELRHPEVGSISGRVRAVTLDGVEIGFQSGTASVAFALAAITADMSRAEA